MFCTCTYTSSSLLHKRLQEMLIESGYMLHMVVLPQMVNIPWCVSHVLIVADVWQTVDHNGLKQM